METARRFLELYPDRFGAYLALERSLMRCYLARGGSFDDFCRRVAPVYRLRFAPLLWGREPVAPCDLCGQRRAQSPSRAA
ncbi:MAG: hypothetical protein ACREKN_05275 [Longimicrobiaceae bacterium]